MMNQRRIAVWAKDGGATEPMIEISDTAGNVHCTLAHATSENTRVLEVTMVELGSLSESEICVSVADKVVLTIPVEGIPVRGRDAAR